MARQEAEGSNDSMLEVYTIRPCLVDVPSPWMSGTGICGWSATTSRRASSSAPG
jgi:hypothetical protein